MTRPTARDGRLLSDLSVAAGPDGTTPGGRSTADRRWGGRVSGGGGAVGRNDADGSLKSFQRSSASVASTLQLAIQHENDVVADAGGLLADPSLTQTAFLRWAARRGCWTATRRWPAWPSWCWSTTRPCRRSRRERWPIPRPVGRRRDLRGRPGGPALLLPRGRPVARGSASAAPAGIDLCADPMSKADLLAARDSGQGNYLPYPSGGQTWLAVQTPIYRGGITPATVAARRRRSPAGSAPSSTRPCCLFGRCGTSPACRCRCATTWVPRTSRSPAAPGGRRAVGDDRPAQRVDRADLRRRRRGGSGTARAAGRRRCAERAAGR